MDPLTIGMILSSLGGTALSGYASRKDAQAKNRASQAALQKGIERGRDFEKRALEVSRKAVDEERNLSNIEQEEKDQVLALMANKNQQPPDSRLAQVQSAQRGQASESAAKVIGSEKGRGTLRRKQKSTLLPMGQIIRNAQRDWDVTQQEALSARNNARGGGGLMTIAQLMKAAPLLYAGGTAGFDWLQGLNQPASSAQFFSQSVPKGQYAL